MFFFQGKLLFFPRQSGITLPKEFSSYSEENIVLGYEGKYNSTDTIYLVFHGNAGDAKERMHYTELFPGQNLFLAEYPGFGENIEHPASAETIYEYAQKTFDHLAKKYKRIVVVGESLGTGVATKIAIKNNTEKMMLFTPYTTIAEIAQIKYPFLPVGLILKNNFSNLEIKKYNGKILTIIAGNDEVIPVEKQLIVSKISEKTTVIFKEGSLHGEWFSRLNHDDLITIRNF